MDCIGRRLNSGSHFIAHAIRNPMQQAFLDALQKSQYNEPFLAASSSTSLEGFLFPATYDFLAATPALDGTTNLEPYLFVAQTSLSRTQTVTAVEDDRGEHGGVSLSSLAHIDGMIARLNTCTAISGGAG